MWWILIGVFLLVITLLKVPSRNSRRDEAYHALHPPDAIHKAVKTKDGNTITDANRCVCCGEIIPEGRQTCILCEQKSNPDNAWW